MDGPKKQQYVPLPGQLGELQGSGWLEVRTVSKKVWKDMSCKAMLHSGIVIQSWNYSQAS